MQNLLRSMAVVTLSLAMSACTSTPSSALPAKDDSLYQALGGQPGITRIVEGMLINIADNPRIIYR